MTGHLSSGHTVLAVPVPALEPVVRARTALHDASFLSADPAFCHAHLTLLAPWVASPSAADLARVREVLAGFGAFSVALEEVRAFPDGIAYVAPSDPAPFRALTRALAAAFPACVPYDGAFGGLDDLVPHVTVELTGPGRVSLDEVRALLSPHLPTRLDVDRVDLQRWANHDCRVLASWGLTAPDRVGAAGCAR